jgi:hypothetical protein
MDAITWFQTDIVTGLGAIAQYGLAGICVLLIFVLYKLLTDFRKSMDDQTEVMRQVCVALESVKTMIEMQQRRDPNGPHS